MRQYDRPTLLSREIKDTITLVDDHTLLPRWACRPVTPSRYFQFYGVRWVATIGDLFLV